MRAKIVNWTFATFLFLAVFPFSAQPAEQGSGQILGGSLDAPVRIEVFSDFECPSCRELYLDVMRRVLVDYSSQNKVCLMYHEYPLKIHRYSRDAARYAEAVSRLGKEKLLRVYDVLFMDQAKWSADGRVEASVAKALSRAELQTVKKFLQEPSINAAIEKEIKLGESRRIQSTPTWFIYARGKEQKVEGRITYISLKQFIDSALK
jgi:protein-disulfide isomerase